MVAQRKCQVFMSFASAHTKKFIGACIVEVSDPEDANEECKKLGLMPKECNHARGSVLVEPEKDMEINRFYNRKEMQDMGYGP